MQNNAPPPTSSPHLASPPPALRSALRHSSRPSSPNRTNPSTPVFGTLTPSSSSGVRLQLTPSISHQSNNNGAGAGMLSPPPAGYTPKVSFDTFENAHDDALFSYTLQVKSDGYKRTKRTRVFLCAASPDPSGVGALDWVLESLVQDDDELVVVRGFDSGDLEKDHEDIRDEAREFMRSIQEKNKDLSPDRKLSIIVEFVAGKITETIERLIALYRPDSLIVGTRGQQRGFLESFGAAVGAHVGSVSKYCLSHSPVPVIVVQPHRRQNMAKRRADPKRKEQFDQLTKVTHTGHGAPLHHAATIA